jgi:uncharacterized repeat protein (TIGR03803 family)
MNSLSARVLDICFLARSSSPSSSFSAVATTPETSGRQSGFATVTLLMLLLLLVAPVLGHAQYQYQVLYNFCSQDFPNCTDGSGPTGGLIQDSSGNLYGTTGDGGSGIHNFGTVFKLDSAGQETVLYSFCSAVDCTDGAAPGSGVILDASGNFYGTTAGGGARWAVSGIGSSSGTVFKLDTTGHETVLYSFCSPALGENLHCTDGSNPQASLIQDAAGNLYGTTVGAGGSQLGTLFQLLAPAQGQTTWTLNSLYGFCHDCADGASPYSSLIRDSEGNLYGTTSGGGAHYAVYSDQGAGIVFKVDPAGQETVLYNFCSQGGKKCTDGARPYAGLIQDAAGNFYGTTNEGGANGQGTVFKLDSSGNETVLYSFCSAANCTDGAGPFFVLLLRDASGNLYGSTQAGGASGKGTVFKLDSSGNETVLYSFCSAANCTDGAYPVAGLIEDASGNLYGTTSEGGGNNAGVLFKLSPPEILSPISVSPASLNFGDVKLCKTKQELLTLHNTGATQVQIGAVSFIDVVGNPNDFSFHEYCSDLKPGKSCTIGVKFSPDALTTDKATLNIVTSAPGSPLQVPITATGIANQSCK